MKNNFLPMAFICSFMAVFILFAAETGYAQQSSDDILISTLSALKEKQADGAIKILTPALYRNPDDGRLWYLLGYAQRELRDNTSAISSLRKALRFGYKSPELRQVLGETLLAIDKPKEALEELSKGPNTRRNQLARAIAQLRSGNPQDAIKVLDEVQPTDKEAESFLFIRAIAQHKIEQKKWKDLTPAKNSGYWFDITPGFTSNVNYTDDDDSDMELTADLGSWYRPVGDQENGIIATANASTRWHPITDKGEDVVLGFNMQGYRSLHIYRLETGLGYKYANVDGSTFSNILSWQNAARIQPRPWWRLSLNYLLSLRDFDFDTVSQEDRDGLLHQLTHAQDFTIPVRERQLKFTGYGGVSIENTDGASSDNDGWFLGARGSYPIIPDLNAFAGVSYNRRNFDNPHIRSSYTTKREDDIWRIETGISRPIKKLGQISLIYQFVDQKSNVGDFSYDSHSVGVKFTFRR